MEKLTESQKKIYLSIKKFIKQNKISPSVRDLCKINNLNSPATIHFHLEKLKEKGWITYREKTSRSIVVLGD